MQTKTLVLLLLTWSAALTSAWGNRMETVVKSYIEQYKWIAMEEMRRSGVPASITLAQGLLESSMGMSDLSRYSNNHFGIKCKKNWTGDVYYHKDDDYDREGRLIKSCFRVYDSPEESYRDHSDFLKNNRRYARLFQLSQSDYKSWAHGLKKCGYATDSRYAYKLIEKVEAFRLDQYDRQVLNRNTLPKPQIYGPNVVTPSVPPAFVLPDDYRRGQFKQQSPSRKKPSRSNRSKGSKQPNAQIYFLKGDTMDAPRYRIN